MKYFIFLFVIIALFTVTFLLIIFLMSLIDKEDSDDEKINKVSIYRHIVNPHDFKYLLNPGKEFCSIQNKLFLLVYVHTAPENLKRRIAIRETWANPSIVPDIKTIFIMGEVKDQRVIELIKLEYGIYKDIVQENFIDSYRNLTYKGIAALKWISTYCSNSKFILKVDDDMIVDIFAILEHLKSISHHNVIKPRSILCNLWNKSMVFRDRTSKWYVTKKEYLRQWFGRYCSGAAFLITSDLAPDLFKVSFYVPFFWIDDYYMTGLLARAVNSTYVKMNTLFAIKTGKPEFVYEKFFKKNGQSPVFGHSPSNIDLTYQIWKIILFRHFTNSFDENLAQPHVSFNDFELIKNFKWK